VLTRPVMLSRALVGSCLSLLSFAVAFSHGRVLLVG
jgi:hypothetical protein